MKKTTIIGLVCGAIIIGVTTFVASNMFLKSKSNDANQDKEKTVATANDNDKEKARLEEENKKLQEEKSKLEQEKQKAENEKLKQENEKLKKEKRESQDSAKFSNSGGFDSAGDMGKPMNNSEYEGVKGVIYNYINAFVKDVNLGEFATVGNYLDSYGSLYKEQQQVIPALHKKGITEKVKSIDIGFINQFKENTFAAPVTEVIEITKNGKTETKTFHNRYIVVDVDGYKVSTMQSE